MVNDQNLLSIKAFAKATGRSQQAIYKQLGTRLAPFVREMDGKKYIEHRALKEVFNIDVEQPSQPESTNSVNPPNNPDSELYAILREELAAKNDLINKLQDELAAERKHRREQADQLAALAARAQDLHAGTIRTQLPPAEQQEEPADEAAALVQDAETVLEPSEPQNDPEDLLRGLSFGEKLKLLFFKK